MMLVVKNGFWGEVCGKTRQDGSVVNGKIGKQREDARLSHELCVLISGAFRVTLGGFSTGIYFGSGAYK